MKDLKVLTSNMRKIVAISLLLTFFSANLPAQTITKNSLPKDIKEARMNFQMDFSHALIFGMSEKEFAKFEVDWNKDKKNVIKKFKTGANMGLGKGFKIGDYKEAVYTVKVTVSTITEEGYMICDVDIVDQQNKNRFHIDQLTGGKEPSISVGTKLARIKIWAALTGKKFGRMLKSALSNKEK